MNEQIDEETQRTPFIYYNKSTVLNQRIWRLLKHEGVFQLHYLSMQQHNYTIQKQIQEMEGFFSLIQSWQVQTFLVQGHYTNVLHFPGLLSSIQNIWFTQLKYANIWKCCIQSMQSLQFCNFPVLEELWLDDNYIISIKSLRKCSLTNLKKISLRGNYVRNCEFLPTAQLPRLQLLMLEYWREDPVIGEDICWLLKMENTKLEELEVDSVSRIKQRAAIHRIGQKFNNVILFLKSPRD